MAIKPVPIGKNLNIVIREATLDAINHYRERGFAYVQTADIKRYLVDKNIPTNCLIRNIKWLKDNNRITPYRMPFARLGQEPMYGWTFSLKQAIIYKRENG